MKRALVTGCSGFIGRRLCEKLVAEGFYVVGMGRHTVDGPWQEFIQYDLKERASVSIPADIDTVFHLAGKAHAMSSDWRKERRYFQVNISGTRKLLEAARLAGVRRFVYFSSIKATGEATVGVVDESDLSPPVSMYGRSKRKAEQLVLEGGYVPEPVVLRPTMVYGPFALGNLPMMIRAVDRGYFPLLPDTGNTRSMVHVDDVAQAALLAATRVEAIGQIYILTDGCPYSVRQIHTWICESLGKDMPVQEPPMGLVRLLARVGDALGGLIGRSFRFDSQVLERLTGAACYDSSKIQRELGFVPRHNLRETLPEMISALRGGA